MKNRTKAVLWVILIFTLGVVCGGTLTYLLVRPSLSSVGDGRRGPPRARFRPPAEQVVKRFSKKLNLDARQEAQLRQILEKSHQRYRSMEEENRKQHRAIREAGMQEIRAILRPDQLQKFDEYTKRRDRERKQRRKNSPSPRE